MRIKIGPAGFGNLGHSQSAFEISIGSWDSADRHEIGSDGHWRD